MERFIITRPGTFLLAVIGALIAFSGLGALALGFGVPTVPLLYAQLACYSLFALYVAFAVSDKVAGAVAVAMAAGVPLLLPFARLEYAVRHTPLAALALVIMGAGAAFALHASVMRPELPRSAAPMAPPKEQPAH